MDKRQAFPRNNVQKNLEGMTLRDYFAAKAMTMFSPNEYTEITANKAYRLADAMMKQRQNP